MLKPDVDVVLRPPQPPPSRVARRALALCALACRSQLEPHAGDEDARALHQAVRGWLVTARVDEEFEDAERELVHTPLGQLGREATNSAGWRGEGAAVLAWGLGRWDLPGIDCAVDATEVAQALDWLGDDPLAFCADVRLRARSDVVQLAEMLQVAQWRLERSLAEGPPVSLRAFDAGGFHWPRECTALEFDDAGELLVDGAALAGVPEHRRRLAHRVVLERRRAVNWLAGQHPTYSAVTLET